MNKKKYIINKKNIISLDKNFFVSNKRILEKEIEVANNLLKMRTYIMGK